MSIQAMTWVWGLTGLSSSETLLLLALADQANDDGFCWPSQEVIASRARCSNRSVKRIVASLQSCGLLEVRVRNRQGGRISNMYKLHVGAQVEKIPVSKNKKSPVRYQVSEPEKTVGNPPKGQIGPWRKNSSPGAICDIPQGPPVAPGLIKETKLEPPSIPRNASSPPPGAPGGVDGVDGEKNLSSQSGLLPDWDLICQCLPENMFRMLPKSAAALVTKMLLDAMASGWKDQEILARLSANKLPLEAKNLAGLIIYRLHDVVSCVPPGVQAANAKASAKAKQEQLAAERQLEAKRLEYQQDLHDLRRILTGFQAGIHDRHVDLLTRFVAGEFAESEVAPDEQTLGNARIMLTALEATKDEVDKARRAGQSMISAVRAWVFPAQRICEDLGFPAFKTFEGVSNGKAESR